MQLPPGHPDHIPPERNGMPYARPLVWGTLIVLGLTIAWFALTANPSPPRAVTDVPAQPTVVSPGVAGVTEQRVEMANGKTVTCLVFSDPVHSVSCDWTRATLSG